jgi:hypothetical protein
MIKSTHQTKKSLSKIINSNKFPQTITLRVGEKVIFTKILYFENNILKQKEVPTPRISQRQLEQKQARHLLREKVRATKNVTFGEPEERILFIKQEDQADYCVTKDMSLNGFFHLGPNLSVEDLEEIFYPPGCDEIPNDVTNTSDDDCVDEIQSKYRGILLNETSNIETISGLFVPYFPIFIHPNSPVEVYQNISPDHLIYISEASKYAPVDYFKELHPDIQYAVGNHVRKDRDLLEILKRMGNRERHFIS